MTVKYMCDKCGREIDDPRLRWCVEMRAAKRVAVEASYELCLRCAGTLRTLLSASRNKGRA